MRLAGLAFLLLSGANCTYFSQRAADFGDMFRVEASVGIGLQAHVNAGELAHIGLGSSRRHQAGFHYGTTRSVFIIEDHFPLSYIYTLIDRDDPMLHRMKVDGVPDEDHKGYVLMPGELNRDELSKPTIHYLNIEAGFHAVFLGLEVGFSIGELLDFILGLFKFHDDWDFLDIAGDDRKEQRESRAMRVKRKRGLSGSDE